MGALCHLFEGAGIATTSISLVREHTEAIRPPRALWVPFELGRPFGSPGQPEFQADVLRAALRLLEEEAGPVLADYPHDAVDGPDGDAGWACPLPAPAIPEAASDDERRWQELLAEIRALAPWHDEAVRAAGRTAFGVSGLSPLAAEEAARALWAAACGLPLPVFEGTPAQMPLLLRFLADDLKAFYGEALAAQPGPRPSSRDLNDWLFRQSALGRALYDARDRLAASDDAQDRLTGRFLVPAIYARRQ